MDNKALTITQLKADIAREEKEIARLKKRPGGAGGPPRPGREAQAALFAPPGSGDQRGHRHEDHGRGEP